MARNAVDYEEMLPRMEGHVFSLIEKEKISAGRAAELLHKPLRYLIKKGMVSLAEP